MEVTGRDAAVPKLRSSTAPLPSNGLQGAVPEGQGGAQSRGSSGEAGGSSKEDSGSEEEDQPSAADLIRRCPPPPAPCCRPPAPGTGLCRALHAHGASWHARRLSAAQPGAPPT